MQRKKNKGTTTTDAIIGKNLEILRCTMGLSQGRLGGAIGVTSQQIQKYERGKNRISCARLWDISCVLDAEPAYFFGGLEAGRDFRSIAHQPLITQYGGLQSAIRNQRFRSKSDIILSTHFTKADLTLCATFNAIHNQRTRRSLFNLMKALAGEQCPE